MGINWGWGILWVLFGTWNWKKKNRKILTEDFDKMSLFQIFKQNFSDQIFFWQKLFLHHFFNVLKYLNKLYFLPLSSVKVWLTLAVKWCIWYALRFQINILQTHPSCCYLYSYIKPVNCLKYLLFDYCVWLIQTVGKKQCCLIPLFYSDSFNNNSLIYFEREHFFLRCRQFFKCQTAVFQTKTLTGFCLSLLLYLWRKRGYIWGFALIL